MSPDMECLWRRRTELNGGAQRARLLRPRCFQGGSPETTTPIYHLPSLQMLTADTIVLRISLFIYLLCCGLLYT
jgi:hypothetical protein